MPDHQQAAIKAGARAYDPEAWTAYDRESPSTEGRELMVEYSKSKAESILAAAEPHLRKKWAEEVLKEGILGAGYSVLMNPNRWELPVTTFTRAVKHMIDLLEGAGE